MIFKKKKRRKKSQPLTRCIYLFKRVRGRDWETIINFKQEIKIGIAKKDRLDVRLNEVNRDMPGVWVCIGKYEIKKASTFESSLHTLYKKNQMKVKGAKRGSGSTEVFRLSSSQLRELKEKLSNQSIVKQNSQSVFWVLLISLVVAFIYNYFKST